MAVSENEIIVRLRAEGSKQTAKALDQFSKELGKAAVGTRATFRQTKMLANGMSDLAVNLVRTEKGVTAVGQSMTRTVSNMRRFRMEFLSVLFFSMNAQRQLQRVLSSSITTFTQIASESNRSAQAIATISAQFTFLRFTIGRAVGEALEPLLPVLVGIIDKVADFVEQNPGKAVGTLVGAFVAFSALNIGAQIALVSDGLINIANNSPGAIKGIKAFTRVAGGGVGLFFIYQGLQDLDGNPIGGIGDILAGAGLLRFAIMGKGGFPLIVVGLTLIFVSNPKLFGEVVGTLTNIAISVLRIMKNLIQDLVSSILTLDFTKFGESLKRELGGFFDEAGAGVISKISTENLEFVAGEQQARKIRTFWENYEQEAMSANVSVQENLKDTGFLIGSSTKGSFPIVYSLIQAGKGWIGMADIAVENIDRIIAELNAIPREIVTIHRIVTVREERGGGISNTQRSRTP